MTYSKGGDCLNRQCSEDRYMNNTEINITFNDSDTTADKLIKATQALIATNGYDATTTRMIANLAGVNLSAINFHFGNKESLVQEAVQKAAADLGDYYNKLAYEIRAFLKEEPIDQKKAWEYIDKFLKNRIHRAFDFKNSWINIGIAERENSLPESSRGLMARTAIEGSEKILADLILAVSEKKDVMKAALVSRAISAAIMSYSEKPLLYKYMQESFAIDLEDKAKVEDVLHEYFMKSIAASIAENE